jgi:hypothetical protein
VWGRGREGSGTRMRANMCGSPRVSALSGGACAPIQRQCLFKCQSASDRSQLCIFVKTVYFCQNNMYHSFRIKPRKLHDVRACFPVQYEQHRYSPFLRRTAYYAFSDENKTNLTAAPRPNMSTAAVEHRERGSMRGRVQDNIQCILCILII